MDDLLPLTLDIQEDSIIKVMGVGGGGCNAVNYMYSKGIKDVTFLVCNTDRVALCKSSVPAKLQLGPGLGAGGKPEVARNYAAENREKIREALNDGTKMLFITAGMGGGTGTGASSIVAEVAQEMEILTIGIVTIPFAFERNIKIRKAMKGVAELAKHVDALLVINNEKIKQIYPDLDFLNAFKKSDDVLCNAARAIAEIITVPGYINTDFADVYNTLKDGNVAIMNVGQASGEERITQAITNALNSPLINTNDVHGAKRVLLQFYFSTEHAILMNEIDQINRFVDEMGDEVEVQWGTSIDDSLGEEVRVTIIATGYDITDIPCLEEEVEAGKVSLDDAINMNYNQPSAPKDDEQAVTIDLNAVLHQPQADAKPATEPAAEATQEPLTNDKGEILISFDSTQTETQSIAQTQPKPTTDPADAKKHTGRFGWMRGKKA